ncbi:hypothetical protein FRC03_011279, partial [Tulasnella sp. 419]
TRLIITSSQLVDSSRPSMSTSSRRRAATLLQSQSHMLVCGSSLNGVATAIRIRDRQSLKYYRIWRKSRLGELQLLLLLNTIGYRVSRRYDRCIGSGSYALAEVPIQIVVYRNGTTK